MCRAVLTMCRTLIRPPKVLVDASGRATTSRIAVWQINTRWTILNWVKLKTPIPSTIRGMQMELNHFLICHESVFVIFGVVFLSKELKKSRCPLLGAEFALIVSFWQFCYLQSITSYSTSRHHHYHRNFQFVLGWTKTMSLSYSLFVHLIVHIDAWMPTTNFGSSSLHPSTLILIMDRLLKCHLPSSSVLVASALKLSINSIQSWEPI